MPLGIGVWVVLLVAAPPALFPVGRYICHQRAERSFFIHGRQMAVCARCTGLYAGAAAAVPFVLLLGAAALPSRRARWILAVAALPTLITWTFEFAGLAAFSNLSRFIAALPLGFAAAFLVLGITRGRSDSAPP